MNWTNYISNGLIKLIQIKLTWLLMLMIVKCDLMHLVPLRLYMICYVDMISRYADTLEVLYLLWGSHDMSICTSLQVWGGTVLVHHSDSGHQNYCGSMRIYFHSHLTRAIKPLYDPLHFIEIILNYLNYISTLDYSFYIHCETWSYQSMCLPWIISWQNQNRSINICSLLSHIDALF